MQASKKNASDVIILYESSSAIGVCYETILDNYLKPLLQFFYGMPISDDLGLMKDLSGVVFSAIGFKSIDSLPTPICSFIQPTSHVKLFCEKLENSIEFSFIEDKAHLAEGFALALDMFEDLENKRHGANKIERQPSSKHIVLIASQIGYEDVPIFESNTYRGSKLDEILQNMQKFQINLSIITPRYSPEFIKLYERINGSLNTDVKLDKFNNFSFFVLLHNSIHLIDYEAQQKQLQQQQQQQSVQIQQAQVQPPVQIPAQQPMQTYQETYLNIKMEATESIQNGIINQASQAQQSGYQISQQIAPQITQTNLQAQIQAQQLSQQQTPQQTIHQAAQFQQQIVANQQKLVQHQQIPAQQQQAPITQPYQQPIQTQQDIYTQQQQQQQQQTNMVRTPSNIGKVMPQTQPQIQQQTQQQQQVQVQRQANQTTIIQSQTPPIIQQQSTSQAQMAQTYQTQINIQQQAQQPIPQQPPQQRFPAQAQPQAQAYPVYSQIQQQQQQQPQQQQRYQIWDGLIEWQEKDRQNPNQKVTHTLKGTLFSLCIINPSTGQLIPEVQPSLAQQWPPKIPLQLLGKQILDILSPFCQPPTKNLYLMTDPQNSQELKNALNIGGALINFAANTNQEIRILLVTVQGNDIVCKIPSDQNKFLNSLKQIIHHQKQQQMRLQQPQQQPVQPQQPNQPQQITQQQQQQKMMNPGMIQTGQTIIQSNMMNPNQMQSDQKDLRHLLVSGHNQPMIINQQQKIQPQQNWINPQQHQQQQQQQQQQQIYMQQQQKQNYQQFGGGAGSTGGSYDNF